ncbi:MAG: hypothetical protein GY699_23245 [Desulfobacteraceae bacterium]|nr:hypothetical protein [Desulfobacteraceae bacterium]
MKLWNNIRNVKLYLFGLITVLLVGCAPHWEKIEQPDLKSSDNSFEIKTPVGWVQLKGLEKRAFITKEGPTLQIIEVMTVAKKDAFKSLDVNMDREILISEMAEYYLADFKKKNRGFHIEHIETLPILINEKQGFKLTLEFKNRKGLLFKVIVYGLVHKDLFYTLFYRAPKLYYFDRDIDMFNQVVKSFRILV